MKGKIMLVIFLAMLILLVNGGRHRPSASTSKWVKEADGSYRRVYSSSSSNSNTDLGGGWVTDKPSTMNTDSSAHSQDSTLEYLGCFLDHRDHVFPDRIDGHSHTPITPSSCSKLCYERGQAYSAVQYYAQCFCSDVPPPEYERAGSESECNTHCNADRRQICGGSWRMSVYFAHGRSSQWDKAYHKISGMLSKISSMRQLEDQIQSKEAKMEALQTELDEIRARKTQLEEEVTESTKTKLCSELQTDTAEDQLESANEVADLVVP